MSYGMEVFDENGIPRLQTTEIVARLFAVITGSFAPNQTSIVVLIPGSVNNGDDHYFVKDPEVARLYMNWVAGPTQPEGVYLTIECPPSGTATKYLIEVTRIAT